MDDTPQPHTLTLIFLADDQAEPEFIGVRRLDEEQGKLEQLDHTQFRRASERTFAALLLLLFNHYQEAEKRGFFYDTPFAANAVLVNALHGVAKNKALEWRDKFFGLNPKDKYLIPEYDPDRVSVSKYLRVEVKILDQYKNEERLPKPDEIRQLLEFYQAVDFAADFNLSIKFSHWSKLKPWEIAGRYGEKLIFKNCKAKIVADVKEGLHPIIFWITSREEGSVIYAIHPDIEESIRGKSIPNIKESKGRKVVSIPSKGGFKIGLGSGVETLIMVVSADKTDLTAKIRKSIAKFLEVDPPPLYVTEGVNEYEIRDSGKFTGYVKNRLGPDDDEVDWRWRLLQSITPEKCGSRLITMPIKEI